MPGPHYAISEALIVLVAIWVAYRFAAERAFYGAAGTAILGIAAAIGTIRFGFGWDEEIASLHGSVFQIGGAAAMALIALQLAAKFSKWRGGIGKLAAPALALATLAASLLAPGLSTPIFALWLILAIAFVIAWPHQGVSERLVRGAVIAVFLANVLLIRRSPTLGPDLSWHLFHTLIALWLLGLWWVWSAQVRDSASPQTIET